MDGCKEPRTGEEDGSLGSLIVKGGGRPEGGGRTFLGTLIRPGRNSNVRRGKMDLVKVKG